MKKLLIIKFVLSIFLFISFLFTINSASKLSIYSDEIAYRVLNSQSLHNNGTLTSLFPKCEIADSTKLPLIFYPAKVLDYIAFLKVNQHIRLRLFGIFIFLLIIASLILLCNIFIHNFNTRLNYTLLIISLFTLGALPYSLIIVRPEQFLVLGASIALIIPFFLLNKNIKLQNVYSLSLSIFVLLIFTFLFSNHAKSLFLLPIFIGVCYLLSKSINNKIINLGLFIALIFSCITSFKTWNKILSCNEIPAIAKAIRDQGTDPSILLSNPFIFISKLTENLFEFHEYFDQLVLNVQYSNNWLELENYKISEADLYLNYFIILIFISLIIIIFINFFKKNNITPKKYLRLITFLCVISILAIASFQSSKHFYEISIIFPLIIIAFLLSTLTFIGKNKYLDEVFIILIVLVSIWSQLRFETKGPLFYFNKNKIIFQPGINLYKYELSKFNIQIDKAIKSCNFNMENINHLIIDDLTYFKFRTTNKPILISYFLWEIDLLNKNITEFENELNNIKSSGIVAHCDSIPVHFREKMIKNGEICCYSNLHSH